MGEFATSPVETLGHRSPASPRDRCPRSPGWGRR